MPKFKAGDRVYYPQFDNKVHVLQGNPNPHEYYSVFIKIGEAVLSVFMDDGNKMKSHRLPSLFHATPENKAALETLYGMEFEAV